GPWATNAPFSIFQVSGCSVAGFQPLKVLPSKMATNPSSESAPRQAIRETPTANEINNARFMPRMLPVRAADNNRDIINSCPLPIPPRDGTFRPASSGFVRSRGVIQIGIEDPARYHHV